MSQLDKGDMLREKKLAEKGAGRGMAALIKTGMRAFTIQTPSFSSSLAGFLLPGNRVDVLLTANTLGGSEEETGGASTTTLLQNVEILAVHTNVITPTANKIDPELARSVTLLVSPEDASLLDLGQNKGTLHLSLRNLKDTGSIKPKPTTLADLGMPRFVKPKPVVVEPPAPAPAIDPLPPFDFMEPETIEVKLAVRNPAGDPLRRGCLDDDPSGPASAEGEQPAGLRARRPVVAGRDHPDRLGPAGFGRPDEPRGGTTSLIGETPGRGPSSGLARRINRQKTCSDKGNLPRGLDAGPSSSRNTDRSRHGSARF